jgi:hypothetical protein
MRASPALLDGPPETNHAGIVRETGGPTARFLFRLFHLRPTWLHQLASDLRLACLECRLESRRHLYLTGV